MYVCMINPHPNTQNTLAHPPSPSALSPSPLPLPILFDHSLRVGYSNDKNTAKFLSLCVSGLLILIFFYLRLQ